ncbi:GAF domain-containing protein [Microcoleus sp. ZQ-A2]|nr:GAF domain-containing protein [Microcoleus sp. FACHB-1]
MNLDHLFKWHESPQNQADLRPLQPINFAQKTDQTEDFQTLQPKRVDVEDLLTLYDRLPCICFALNSAKIMIAVSQFAADCLGYEVFELAQQPISEVFYGQDQASGQAKLTAVQQQSHPITQWETRLVRKNGSVLWVRAKASLMPNTRSEPIITLICEDITEYKQAQEVKQQSQLSLMATVEESRQHSEEALQQQFLRQQLLGAIAQRIHQSLNLDKILNTTVDEVRQVLACDRVIIFRLHADGSGVIVVESVDSDWRPISGISIDDRHFAQAYITLYKQGRVQAIEDIYTANLTPCHRDLLAQFQVRANLVVPMVHEEQLWGLLVAQQCSKSRTWQSLEIDLLTSLATQAAIAIQQSELYQQAQTEIAQRQQAEASLQQQFQRERLVSAISGRIRQSLNLEEILNATADEVRQVLQTDRVVIFRFEPDWSGNVVVESVASSCFSILGRNIYDPCFKQSYIVPYQQGRVKAIEDIYTANIDPCHLNLLTQLQVRANLVVPILQNEQTLQNQTSPCPEGDKEDAPIPNRLWGLLIAHHCTEPRTWGQWEMDLLTSLASQVAIALQQSQLYEQAQYQRQREQALNQLTQAIRRSLDLQTIFSTATCEIENLLEVDCVQIMQYLPEQKLWVSVAESCKGLSTPVCQSLEISDENNPIADRLKRLEVVRIDDIHLLQDEVNNGCVPTLPRPWLMVPLHFSDSMWGALALVMNTESYHWQDSQVELICKVADQLAIALQQAELYKQSCTAMAHAQSQAQQLEQTLIELRQTQAQLVQSEKMSSLGQLVAGVAHEINNPVSFIYGNLMHASDYAQDILGLLQLYQQYYPHPVPEIEGEIAAIDLDFLLEDLPKLLSSMKVGAERICEIVAALRNFSRFAEAEIKPVDLHEGVDSTLMILQNRLKASGGHPEIKVIKEYGNLPLVECYAGQLNQVFMNLLSNAIDAIDEQNQTLTPGQINANPSYIRVCTELCNDYEVAIRIADNGPGIAEDVKARLFDPFFTTKPVGTGTGLGLSISYQIVVEKHGGQLHCYSQLGQGTEFVIQIPIQQPPKKP